MTFGISVQGGTNAGIRKPLRDKPSAWTCACNNTTRLHPGYMGRCADCGTKRP